MGSVLHFRFVFSVCWHVPLVQANPLWNGKTATTGATTRQKWALGGAVHPFKLRLIVCRVLWCMNSRFFAGSLNVVVWRMEIIYVAFFFLGRYVKGDAAGRKLGLVPGMRS